MKSIDTLVQDIYYLVSNPKDFNRDNITVFASTLAEKLTNRLSEERGAGMLRASNLGKCDRELWYDVHCHTEREPLPPATRIKFLFGDVLEELLLFLAREAGHDVQNEQAEIDVHGVKGHIDATIDGRLVDAKSTSPIAFTKFANHTLPSDDSFGYLTQLNTYLEGASSAGIELKDKDVASFLAIDKSGGHITLDSYPKQDVDYAAVITAKKKMLAQPEPPPRPYTDVPFQKSGNRKLGVKCSYCPFKFKCWPGLRVFQYAGKPVFLTDVSRPPKVDELSYSQYIAA